MKDFAELVYQIDSTTKTNERVAALSDYLANASDRDKIWCIALLGGKRPKRPVKVSLLRQWASDASGIPLWLLEESYFIVGDLAETLALILPSSEGSSKLTLTEAMDILLSWHNKVESEIEQEIKKRSALSIKRLM